MQDEWKQKIRTELTKEIEWIYAERSKAATKRFQAAIASMGGGL